MDKKFPAVVCLIPNFHYDVEYLKTYREYLPVCFANIKEALAILGENRKYTYLVEQAIMLAEFWRRFPAHRPALRRFVQAGRIEIAPGMWVMPDMNIPSGESLIRQTLLGKEWIRRHLGVDVKTAWMADCFGHNAQVPQVLHGCGYSYYAFTRGIDTPRSKSEFFWEGLDGTEILAHWMVCGYGGMGSFTEDREEDFRKVERILKVLSKHGTGKMCMLGNGGDFVKPQRNAPLRVTQWNRFHRDQKIRFRTPRQFFEALLRTRPRLRTLKAELNPDRQGCYSSRIQLKQWNRDLEVKAYQAEVLATLSFLRGVRYPKKELETAWKWILTNQFHDTLCGTIVDKAYQDALRRYREADRILSRIAKAATVFLSGACGSGKRTSIHVFNTLDRERRALVEVKCPSETSRVLDQDGNEILSQKIGRGHGSRLVFSEVLPPFMGRTFHLSKGKAQTRESGFVIGDRTIENRFYRLRFDKKGALRGLVLKDGNLEFVDKNGSFNNLVLQDDNGDLWYYYEGPLVDSAGVGFACDRTHDPIPCVPRISRSGRRTVGFFRLSQDVPKRLQVTEKGPVRLTVRSSGELQFWRIKVRFVQHIRIYRDLGRIDFDTEILPRGKHFRLRVAFATNIKGGGIRHEIPFGSIQRPEGEYPAQNWMSYGNGKKGLLLLNRGLPGNNVTGGVMMLSLFRSVAMEYKGPSATGYAEGIPHTFRYSLVPYANRDSICPAAIARDFNIPVLSDALRPVSDGKRYACGTSFLRIEPSTVIVSALKKAEGSREVILRMYEGEGKDTAAEVEFDRFSFKTFLKHNQIKTFRVDLRNHAVKEVNLVEV